MKALFLSLSILCFNTLAMACEQGEISFSKNNVCAKIDWITGPTFNQMNSATVRLSETSLKLNVVPWMVMDAGHEHGSRPAVITTVSPTDYLVEKLYFMGGMSGNWFLKLQLINDKKEVIEEVREKVL